MDSIAVSIIRTPEPINLGADTVLCNQNTLTLHAGNNFALYQWQDGSIDSTLIINAPGIYWVKAIDRCGNNFIDSITINPFSLSINIGADRIKCNADTVQLHGPAGFINYQWSNNYNINATTLQHVIVNPSTDTAYYLKAEKFPGCFAYDTIKINVQTSPAIALGADKSICTGDTAVLDAGSGFTTYQWSNGSAAQQISVVTQGSYSVMATAANGCKSTDTLQIINVWANPVVTLDHNPELCAGTTRNLQAGSFASYRWQDGSTAPSFTVSNTGTYYLAVTDIHNCKGSDTVIISKIIALPANFLPADTAICTYGKVLITASGHYSKYVWSNNSVTSSITVTLPGTYWLRVTDNHQCSGRDSIVVNPKDCFKGFNMPTGFTPNADGRNDDLKPAIAGNVVEYQLTIYGRWGQVVFTTTDIQKGWNGMYKGLQQDSNVFVWTCSYRLQGEQKKTEKGTVALIR